MTSRSKKKKFSKFYNEHVEKVYRFVYLKVSSKEVSQDLTSEVFLRFWEQLNSPIKIENQRAFIYQIARNLVIDYYRKTKPTLIDLDKVKILDQARSLEEKAILGSDMEVIQRALTQIPEDYQDMIIWYYLDEFSVPEIAEITGKTENNIRVTIHRALSALKEKLD